MFPTTSNVTGRHRGPKQKLRAGYRAPSLKRTSCYRRRHYNALHVAISFHRRMWYRALSLRYACIRSSGIILIPYATFVPNFVPFAASIAELAIEKSRTQSLNQSLNHLPSLFDAPGTEAFALEYL